MILNTYIFIPVRHDFIGKALKTLYKFTDMKNSRVIVIDQTKSRLNNKCKEWKEIKPLIHLYMHSYRNLGFAKAHNEGIIHALHWGSKYITCANDDIEFIDDRWWQGVLDTFAMESVNEIFAVNPESPRIPLWGYGRPHGEYMDILKYRSSWTRADYDYLLAGNFEDWKEQGELKSEMVSPPSTFPLQKRGVTDAVATWLTVFKRECFERFGLWDEKYYVGGGEDYDYNARVYRENGRMLGTTKSWVWHHWGYSKDRQGEIDTNTDDSLRWSNPDYLWPPEKNLSWNESEQEYQPKVMDPWAKVKLKDGTTKPMYRIPTIHIIDI